MSKLCGSAVECLRTPLLVVCSFGSIRFVHTCSCGYYYMILPLAREHCEALVVSLTYSPVADLWLASSRRS